MHAKNISDDNASVTHASDDVDVERESRQPSMPDGAAQYHRRNDIVMGSEHIAHTVTLAHVDSDMMTDVDIIIASRHEHGTRGASVDGVHTRHADRRRTRRPTTSAMTTGGHDGGDAHTSDNRVIP